jgi:hypothetical protein
VIPPAADHPPRPEATDRLLPFSIDFRRFEIELFEPLLYVSRESPPFLDSFVRTDDAKVVAADLAAYLAWFEPLAGALRDQPALHIFMVNRCGSTLLLNALSRLPGIAGFNELDPWAPGTTRSELIDRIDEALGAHMRHWAAAAGRRLLFKHRGEMLGAAGRLLGGFPSSRALFLVRHYDQVIGSQLAAPPGSFPGPVVLEIERTSPSLWSWAPQLRAEIYAAFYVDTVERYRALASSSLGGSIRCLRYETLVRDPVAAVTAVAAFFGLEVGDALELVRAELRRDAKARAGGTEAEFVAPTRREPTRFRAAVREALERAWAEPLPGELAV